MNALRANLKVIACKGLAQVPMYGTARYRVPMLGTVRNSVIIHERVRYRVIMS